MLSFTLFLQGDVVALIDANGTQVVEYGYDAWGYPISKTGSLAATIGTLNPFRYRGYVYDEETGLYYLRSRYYNPVWKRFNNTDARISLFKIANDNNTFEYGTGWKHKPGTKPVETYRMIDGSTPWKFGEIYDSEIIYFALKRDWQ